MIHVVYLEPREHFAHVLRVQFSGDVRLGSMHRALVELGLHYRLYVHPRGPWIVCWGRAA